jgi:hypothetical protein
VPVKGFERPLSSTPFLSSSCLSCVTPIGATSCQQPGVPEEDEMHTLAILSTVAVLIFLLGAVIGAEIQDRITEDQRRRQASQRRAVNAMLRQLAAVDRRERLTS